MTQSISQEESQPSPKADSKPQENGRFRPGVNGQPKGSPVNGVDKRNGHVRQRVPNADDFPVLAGSLTPPSRRSPGPHLPNGPTAAQVLQAPAPMRKDSSKDGSPRVESQLAKVSNELSICAFVRTTYSSMTHFRTISHLWRHLRW